MQDKLIVTIDSGGSKSDFLLLDSTGDRLGRATAPGVASPRPGMLPVLESLRRGRDLLGAAARAPALVFCSLGGPNTAEVEATLRTLFPESRVMVERESTGRMVLSCAPRYHAAAAVLCGTGSVAFGLLAKNAPVQLSGGWGPLYGDEGSGGGLGTAALKRLLRAVDDGNAAQILPGCFPTLARPAANCGFAERMAFKDEVLALTRAQIAAESPRIAALADDGDAMALELLRNAATEVARLAATVTPQQPWGDNDAILALGGFFRSGEHFHAMCDEALRPLRPDHHFCYEPFKIIDAAAEYALHLNHELP